MPTLDKDDDQPNVAVVACYWCRMGLHKKCVKRTRSLELCQCECERGY